MQPSRKYFFLLGSSLDVVPSLKFRTEAQAKEIRKNFCDLGPDEDLRIKEDIFNIGSGDPSETSTPKYFAASLETVLAGHEDKVFGVQFKQKYNIQPIHISDGD